MLLKQRTKHVHSKLKKIPYRYSDFRGIKQDPRIKSRAKKLFHTFIPHTKATRLQVTESGLCILQFWSQTRADAAKYRDRNSYMYDFKIRP